MVLLWKGLIMTEQGDFEQRRKERRSEKDRRETSLPVDNDRRKSQRRSGTDRRET